MNLNVKKLEAERKRLGLSRVEFSKTLGFESSSYGKMIRKKSTKIKTVTAIADKLHIDPRDLLVA